MDLTKAYGSFSADSLLQSLGSKNTPKEKASVLVWFLSSNKGLGAIPQTLINTADEIIVEVYGLQLIGTDGLTRLGQLLSDESFCNKADALYMKLCKNLIKENVPLEEAEALIERSANAQNWPQANVALDSFYVRHLLDDYRSLDPVERQAFVMKFNSNTLKAILPNLNLKTKEQIAAQEGEAGTKRDEGAGNDPDESGWAKHFPIIGFIGSLVAAGIGLLWSFKAKVKTPPVILTLLGIVGAIGTAIWKWCPTFISEFKAGYNEGAEPTT